MIEQTLPAQQLSAVDDAMLEASIKPHDLSKLVSLRERIIQADETFHFAPLRHDQVVLTPRSVEIRASFLNDLDGYSLGGGRSYENKCFNQIPKSQETFLLGPHAVDYFLMSSPLTKNDYRPDSIKFYLYSQDYWTLAELYEFKSSGRNHNAKDKVDGFSSLLSKLRDHPHYLPNLLNHGLRDLMDPPKQIKIPDDRFVQVTFIYPTNGGAQYRPSTDFHLKYDYIPL